MTAHGHRSYSEHFFRDSKKRIVKIGIKREADHTVFAYAHAVEQETGDLIRLPQAQKPAILYHPLLPSTAETLFHFKYHEQNKLAVFVPHDQTKLPSVLEYNSAHPTKPWHLHPMQEKDGLPHMTGYERQLSRTA